MGEIATDSGQVRVTEIQAALEAVECNDAAHTISLKQHATGDVLAT